mmetsp:Transcript_86865/g.119664  ORF Transcript_86865/g.119664 Transcript_86865/m.119664 type:complete len:183 (+) Transcript_86865:443-991(+)
MEGAHKIKSGHLVSLSEQQLIDCDTDSHGCNGGDKGRAFAYAESHKMMLESDYSYRGTDGHSCRYSSSKGKVGVKTYTNVKHESSSQLKSAIYKQPVSVTVDGHESVFKHYSSGILCSGCNTSLGHAILAVGYGTENGKEYYLVKNSWGTHWGDKGYGKIGVSSGIGCCGIQGRPVYPTVAN